MRIALWVVVALALPLGARDLHGHEELSSDDAVHAPMLSDSLRNGATAEGAKLDEPLLSYFDDLLLRAFALHQQREVAAFLVIDSQGGIQCVLWPSRAGVRGEAFTGSVPAGTIAIVHTHPNGWELPSTADVGEAQRLVIPFVVLTRWDIYVARADGRIVPVVHRRNWRSSPHAKLPCGNAREPQTDVASGHR